MASCPQLFACGLHRNVSMKEALRVWQSFYCEASFARCERFKLVAAGLPVPEKLLPNGRLIDAGDGALLTASGRR
jgi:hypothetical protein